MDVSKIIQLKPAEEVLEVIREDLSGYIGKFLLAVLWFIVPFFFMFPLFRSGMIGVIVFFALVISAAVFGSRLFFKWSRTVLVITDRRIVDVEQRGFLDQVVSEIPFPQVEDVSYRIKGFFPTVLRVGVMIIKTVGNAADIEFVRVRRPARLHDLINDLREAVLDERTEHKKKQIEQMADAMSIEEVRQVAKEVRKRERDQAMEDLFEE